MTAPDWIYPGADIVVYADRIGSDSAPTYYETTVAKVATKSFTVTHDRVDERINLADLSSKSIGGSWDSWRWRVVKPGSEKHLTLVAARKHQQAETAARWAVADWNTGAGRSDLVKLDAAIAALTTWRDTLTRKQDQT